MRRGREKAKVIDPNLDTTVAVMEAALAALALVMAVAMALLWRSGRTRPRRTRRATRATSNALVHPEGGQASVPGRPVTYYGASS